MNGRKQSLLVRGGHVLDADARRYRKRDIRIRDAVFVELDERLDAEPGEQVLDAEGLWVLPGLIDAHVHAIGVEDDLRALHRVPPYLVAAKSAKILEAMLARGFTSVRDAGGADGSLAEAVSSGLFTGPRLFPSGRGLAPHGGQGDYRSDDEAELGCLCCAGRRSITRLATGVRDLRRAVRQEIAAGATQIKVMASGGIASPAGPESPQYGPDELQAVVAEAARAGLYVMAHAYGAVAIRRCLDAGIHSIEHGSGLDEATAGLMAERGAVLVPTLVVFDRLARSGGALAPAASRILEQSYRSMELARRFGVAIAHGTDLEGSAHDHQSSEFRLKAEAMPASEVIASATSTSARLLRGERKLGTIETGAVADLVAVDKDPLLDIDALAKPDRYLRLVVKDGTVELDRRAPADQGVRRR